MLENIDFDHIKNTVWYRQGGAGRPYYFYVPFKAGMKVWKGDKNIILKMQRTLHQGYFNKATELELAQKDISKQKRNKKYIDKLISRWFKYSGKMDKLWQKIEKTDLSILSNNQLIRLFKKLIKLDFKLWYFAIHIEVFDPWAEEIIQEAVNESGLQIKSEDLASLISPNELTIAQQEELDLLKICLSDKNKIEELLKQQQDKYFWITNDWANIINLPVEYFKDRFVKLNSLNLEEIAEKAKEIESLPVARKVQKGELKKQYQIPGFLENIFYFFSRMSYWRDERKKFAQRNNNYYKKFGREFSKRLDLDFEYISFLLAEEIIDSKLNFSEEFKEKLKARAEACIYYVDNNGKKVFLTGKEFEEFNAILDEVYQKQFSELKGMPASLGLTQGIVKIINVPADFVKMQKGDILVAPMTRPEYLPLMKMASAIVTDEGGVTCHAAIISRELGIPCIIGTQVATEILHDGDLVEVDANKGIIKKI